MVLCAFMPVDKKVVETNRQPFNRTGDATGRVDLSASRSGEAWESFMGK